MFRKAKKILPALLLRGMSILLFFSVLFCAACTEPEPSEREPFTAPPPSGSSDTWTDPAGYTLVWSDEFTDPAINLENWSYETEDTGWSPSWNGEWQRYTENGTGDRNACINDGVLVIKGIETTGGNGGYTSARMVTKDLHSWQYGIIAARLQLPYGQGMWPAFWILGNNGSWPANGEIDIMEMIGGADQRDYTTHAAVHWDDNGLTSASDELVMPEKLCDDWHYYECEWTASSILIRIDGTTVLTQDITTAAMSEFHQPAYILLNLAIGGTWPGPPDETSEFPQYMYIDWVRVYQAD
ncbi:MAG: glycoside hydrolase family 16 protein [Spirochaetales bacterium]|nr:glycoside hydrolase family 16 protein [Spirochaetales bacterium]